MTRDEITALVGRLDEEITVEALYDTKQTLVLMNAKSMIERLAAENARRDVLLNHIAEMDQEMFPEEFPAPEGA